ncbi:AAA domain [Trypanosoma vivax]|uniref:Putative adenylate kinase n=1 Tax=Trypanosoma vivax (strain Y486) TaxID=1055687 RepID=G0U5Q2_TRYVY|nr:putative adenylate kinase [Trypanosoma vivax]KAH8608220.1 AAA domain [Trypanosoma vivax]CCC51203.1 putative adenylate kinase [Trypanosoma vivax Y486]
MHVFLLGPPGSGKTSVSTVLKERYGFCHVDVNEAVSRAVEYSETVTGDRLRQLMSEGKQVPDTLLTRIVAEATKLPDCTHGFLLDGFPRTAEQAQQLKAEGVEPDAIVLLTLSDYMLIDRYSGRWVHPSSGRMYHTYYNPPRVKGKDDVTGQPLIQRPEDTVEAVRERIVKFHKNIRELKGVYTDERMWHKVDGFSTLDTVHLSICSILDPIIEAKNRRWWSKLLPWIS